MVDSIIQTIEKVLLYLELRPGLWVITVGLLLGISVGLTYKKVIVRAVEALTGKQQMSARCADAHAVLIQLLSGSTAAAAVWVLWPYPGPGLWVVALCVGLSCGLVYDLLRAFIGWKWPEFAKRLGLPRAPR